MKVFLDYRDVISIVYVNTFLLDFIPLFSDLQPVVVACGAQSSLIGM